MQITTCTTDHPLPDGEVRILSSARSVTPSLNLVRTGGAALLVDCGAPRDRRDWRPPREAIEAEALLVTHAHADHISGVPALFAEGFRGPIFTTPATLAIARYLLADGLRLQGASRGEIAHFAEEFGRRAKTIRYDEVFRPIEGRPIEVAFREAGHLLGSASVEITSPEARLICSGDLGRPSSPLLRDYNTEWRADRPVDLVVLESTYGDRDHEVTPADVRDRLEAAIHRALEDGGHILVPAFALGRTQVLLSMLNDLVESGRIRELPVAVDTPLGLKVTETFKRFRRLYDRDALAALARGDDPLDFEDLYAVRRSRDSARLRDLEQPMLIIAGSGMCQGGRITDHLIELLPKPETAVFFVGYQAEGTRGRAILDAAQGRGPDVIEIAGRRVRIRAAIEQIPGISAHADRAELTSWLAAIPNVDQVALNHGEPRSQEALAARIKA